MTVLLVLPKTILVAKNLSCSCTTCIVYVNLFKDRFVLRLLFFSESGCKGKNFLALLPNVFGSFFLFFLFPSSSLLSKGRQKEKEEAPRHRLLKEECQLALLSFPKAGAKVRTFKYYFQMFQEVFFSFFFPKDGNQEENRSKERKKESLPLRFTVRMSKHRRLRSRKRMQK